MDHPGILLKQEPGTNREIKEFCRVNYGVSFPKMSKIPVKGRDIHPLYRWLPNKPENGVMNANVKWNFQKFLIDEEGKPVASINPLVNPVPERIVSWIEGID